MLIKGVITHLAGFIQQNYRIIKVDHLPGTVLFKICHVSGMIFPKDPILYGSILEGAETLASLPKHDWKEYAVIS